MSQNVNLAALAQSGVSVWLDDLSRERITSGNLATLINTWSISGVTTNPSIFQAALSNGDSYAAQVAELKSQGVDAQTAIKIITTDDVREACDIFLPLFEQTSGVDGRVSIEVDPLLANDTDATIAAAVELWTLVDRPNVLIKIPATLEGIPAIEAAIGKGISVNVTLIFSVDRYKAVMDAYLAGLATAKAAGIDISTIHSVASFFVSRVDSEIDNRLTAIGSEKALSLKGKAALANARLAYVAYQKVFENSEIFGQLQTDGGNPQRPLWASTGVKNPDYPDTLYVSDLVAPGTVNTIPEKTLAAFADHGSVTEGSILGLGPSSQDIFDQLTEIGISFTEVFQLLETDGVDKFKAAWTELVAATTVQLEA